jgi:hypothetical protein
MLNNQPFIENKDAGAFAQAIVDTVREPLLVLDLHVLAYAARRLRQVRPKAAARDRQRHPHHLHLRPPHAPAHQRAGHAGGGLHHP